MTFKPPAHQYIENLIKEETNPTYQIFEFFKRQAGPLNIEEEEREGKPKKQEQEEEEEEKEDRMNEDDSDD
jgi:hypothetical protein